MEDDDEEKNVDKRDHIISKDERSSHTITPSDRGFCSQRNEPTSGTIATSDSGYGSQRDESTSGTITIYDRRYGSQRHESTSDTIVTSDRRYGSQRDDTTPGTIAASDCGQTDLNDKLVTQVGEGCSTQDDSEMIQHHQQTDIRSTLTGDDPTLIGKQSTVIYNFSGRKRKSDTMETSEDRDNPFSKQPHYENNMSVERATSNIKESFGSGACNTRYGRTEDTNVKNAYDDSAVSEVRQGQKRKRDAIETLDCRDIPSSKQQQYKTNTTAGRTTSNTIEAFEGGQGALMPHQNEVIQVQNRSKLCITSKGDGPMLVGDKSKVVYNITENCSEAIEDLNREMREVMHQSESQLKKTIAEAEGSIVEKISQQFEGLNRVNKSSYACDQRKNLDHEETMKNLCGISTRQKEIMKQQEEMLISSVKKNENADLTEQRNIIGQTENWIREQRSSSQFVTTKAFAVAKDKIKEKRFVVIRGDSGAGKTRLAIELLDWLQLSNENHMFNGKKPLRLPNLQSWDKVISANSNLTILLDDVLGYSSDDTQNLAWWQQHAEMIKPIVHGKESANYLVITVRNDIYHEYKSKFGCLSLFDEENVIDLSSPDYILEEERAALLSLYTSKINNFEPFTESEVNQIIDVSPPIGFPECCRIFKITPELHSERVTYFRRPLQSLRMVIREKFNRAKQTALLYLLLSTEPVSTERLDFENTHFDKEGIERVFRISAHVFPDSYNDNDSPVTQIRCLQRGLDVLCGSFVHKAKGIFTFFHDSIRDTVAILYGEVTPTGFLKNCPSSCLHYLATHQSKNTLCKVVIDESVYEIAYQRILRELETKQHSSYITVASMSPWNDEEFLTGFFSWFKSNKYSPEEYFIRWETDVPLILPSDREDVNFIPPGYISKDTPSSFLVYAAKMNSFLLLCNLLEKFKKDDISNHTKFAFDVALSEGSVECATHLFTLKIQPDFSSCCCAAVGGEVKLMQMIAASMHPLTDAEKCHILILTCLYDRYRICAYLLDLFPFLLAYKEPLLDRHLLHIIAENGAIECFKVVVNLLSRDCQSDGYKQLSLKSLTDGNGSTVLHSAFSSLNRNMLLYLLKEHPSLLTQKDKLGSHGLLLMALCCNIVLLTEKDIESVIKRICHDDMMESLIDEDGNTILHWACFFGNEDLCVKLSSSCRSLLLLRNDRGDHCLHLISSTGNVECFKSVVALLLEENEREQYITSLVNKAGKTVLHFACLSGQLEMCLYLIKEYPATLCKKDNHGHHCLHFVALSGNSESFKSIASLVLEGKSKTEKENFMKNLQTPDGKTVLHHACITGKTDLCLYLIREYHQLLNQKDKIGHHCLHMIAQNGKVECFKAIEASVLKCKSKTDKERFMETLTVETEFETVLHNAAMTGNTEMCLYLIKEYPKLAGQKSRNKHHFLHGIALSGNVDCFKSVAALVLNGKTKTEREQFLETIINDKEETVLHHACVRGQTDMCLYLIIEYPKLFSQTNKSGDHSLHYIAISGNVECFKTIASKVLKDKTKTECELFMEKLTNTVKETVLHHACRSGQTEMCLYLVTEYPRLFSQRDKISNHCLHEIAVSGNVKCFQAIAPLGLENGITSEFIENLSNESNNTVLHHACQSGHKDMCLYLIAEYPGLFSQRDKYGNHCLHLTVQVGNVECFKAIVALVLEHKTKPEREQFLENILSEDEENVLFHACLYRKTDICLYLIREYPLLISRKNILGTHCLHVISKVCNVECFKTVVASVLKDKTGKERDKFIETLLNENGWTVLHHACLNKETDMCLYLMREYPKLISQRDKYGNHCLHLAAHFGNVERFEAITALVLEHKTKSESEGFMENLLNKDKETVLHHASHSGQTDICLFLIIAYPKLVSQRDKHGNHFLHCMVRHGSVGCLVRSNLNYKSLETIISKASEIAKIDFHSHLIRFEEYIFGDPCLRVAAQSEEIERFKSIVEIVLQGKTKTEREQFMGELINEKKQTILYHALASEKIDMCLYLTGEYPGLLNQRDIYGYHCLHYIAHSGNVEYFQAIADLFLKDKTKTERELFMVNLINENGQTVLHCAPSTDLCLYLISEYPKLLDKTDQESNHCIHFLARTSNIECFQAIAALVLKDKTKSESQQFINELLNVNGKTVLHHASTQGQTEMCSYLIREYPELVHQRDRYGYHCLHWIARSGNIGCFKTITALVLKDIAKPKVEQSMENIIDKDGSTVLHVACSNGQTQMCSYLIGAYPKLLSRTNYAGIHCLHFIAQSGNVECFQSISSIVLKDETKLRREQFIVTLLDKHDSTVLHHAAFLLKTDMCLYLIKEYPKLVDQKGRKYEEHILHLIAFFGNVECFQSISTLVMKDQTKLERERCMETLLDLNGLTVLDYATLSRKTEMCAYLIKQYPKLRVKIEGKKIMDTLTHNDDTSSLNHMCVTGNTAMCLYLMKKYPSTLHQKGPLGSHCLHLIAASGIVNCFKSVIPLVHPGKTKYEAEQFIETLTDDYGQTCLHHACVKGHTEMCLYLAEEYWSLLEKKNRYGSHCLHLAAKSGRVDCFKVVVILILGDKTKSNVISSLETLTNRNGKTVLHKAGVKGKTEMCEYLVSEFPSLLSQRSVGGNHCLHYIAQSGQIECFKSVATLTLKGKNEKEREKFMLDLKNNRGKTVLEKARENQQTEMCSYLEREFNFLSEKKLHAH